MESSRKDDRLSAALEALRPIPAPAFAAELDERAAGGFRREEGSEGAPWARFADWLRALAPRQMLLPAAATAFFAVVLATVVVATNEPGSRPGPQSEPHSASDAENGSGVLGYLKRFDSVEKANVAPQSSAGGSASEAQIPNSPTAGVIGPEGFLDGKRNIERSAQIGLRAEPDAVAEDASQVFEAVHAAHGVVLRSSVNEGSEEGVAEAHFELLIPSAQLDDALGAISEIDEVLFRRDGTTDITAPTVGATERLQDSQARIDSLLNELAASETEVERETIETKLRSERRRAAFLGAQLATLRHRASMSHVSVSIEGGDSASGAGGGWDLGDAARDAGHILAVAAGVVLIGLAVLAPIALIALLFWLGRRAWVHYGRRRALS